MRDMPRLKWNDNDCPEGSVIYPTGWYSHEVVTRADALSDWIRALSDELQRTRKELESEVAQPMAGFLIATS
jgi:hypothetical protein